MIYEVISVPGNESNSNTLKKISLGHGILMNHTMTFSAVCASQATTEHRQSFYIFRLEPHRCRSATSGSMLPHVKERRGRVQGGEEDRYETDIC